MIEPVSLSLGAASATIVKSVSERFAEGLSRYLANIGHSAKDNIIARLKIGFTQHLTTSYTRCLHYKTLLSTNTPQDITKDYINVFLRRDDERILDSVFVNQLHEKKSIVIVGSAGSGKSMLMKFLTINKTLYPDGRLPLFVDLRRTNSITDFDLPTFIRNYCTNKSSDITPEQFAIALAAGSFTLVLDGFDEIDPDKQDRVQQQILELRHGYPEITIVVSSRTDTRFGSWPSFHVYEVEPLTKQQCLALISTFVYDTGVKSRFKRQVDDRLYDMHTSFLSSPLLITIMLLTFEGFAEIPTRIHVFYDQAFDTLFQRHDALKEQFQRKIFSGMSLEDFKTSFSVFCAMSYLNHQLNFKGEALLKLSKQSLQYASERGTLLPQPLNPKNFVKDLQQSVCMLRPDGLEMTFVHRSFQEFFTAYFLINCDVKLMKVMLDKLELKHNDSVIPMALEMSRERLEQEWVLPTICKLEAIFFEPEVINSPALQLRRLAKKLVWSRPNNLIQNFQGYGMMIELEGSTHSLLEILSVCYGKVRETNLLSFLAALPTTPNLRKILNRHKKSDLSNAARLRDFFKSTSEKKTKSGNISVQLDSEDDWWLKEVGVENRLLKLKQVLAEIRDDIETRRISRTSLFETSASIFSNNQIDQIDI